MKVKICGIKTLSAAKAALKPPPIFLVSISYQLQNAVSAEETAKEIIAELRGPRPVARKVRFTGVSKSVD